MFRGGGPSGRPTPPDARHTGAWPETQSHAISSSLLLQQLRDMGRKLSAKQTLMRPNIMLKRRWWSSI